MVQPYFKENELTCEQCDGEIYHGYEFIEYDNMFFHDNDCLTDWFLENAPINKYFLTKNKRHM